MDENYRKALLREIHGIPGCYENNMTLTSIYFGGGTPSLAPIATIKAVLATLQEKFSLASDVEITMEMDPGTFDLDQLEALRDSGVNRVSLGVQALQDNILEILGRVHRVRDIHGSLDMLKRVFGEEANYSIDLITGVPGLTLADWADTLHQITRINPKHLSVYDLQVEENTKFGQLYLEGRKSAEDPLPLPSAEDAAFMYQYTAGYLSHKGWDHYEVSSYGKIRSRHNQVYWGIDTEWFAIGLGATSWINQTRVVRPRAMADYLEWTEGMKVSEEAEIDDDDQLENIILKRLRTIEGLDLEHIEKQFGSQARQDIERGAALGIEVGLARLENSYLSLVDSKGFLFSNSIISNIFAELE